MLEFTVEFMKLSDFHLGIIYGVAGTLAVLLFGSIGWSFLFGNFTS